MNRRAFTERVAAPRSNAVPASDDLRPGCPPVRAEFGHLSFGRCCSLCHAGVDEAIPAPARYLFRTEPQVMSLRLRDGRWVSVCCSTSGPLLRHGLAEWDQGNDAGPRPLDRHRTA